MQEVKRGSLKVGTGNCSFALCSVLHGYSLGDCTTRQFDRDFGFSLATFESSTIREWNCNQLLVIGRGIPVIKVPFELRHLSRTLR